MNNIDWKNATETAWDFKFKCPECGSSFFGTDYYEDDDNQIGRCHGEVFKFDEAGVKVEQCSFEWKRTEDYKVFIEEKKRLPVGSMHYGR
jgi:hypothetical protein